MRKLSGLKLGIGAAIAVCFAILPKNAFAAASVEVGGTNIVTSGQNADQTATYNKTTKTLTLNGFSGAVKITDLEVTVQSGSKANKVTTFESNRTVNINGAMSVNSITITGDSTNKTPVLNLKAKADITVANSGSITITHTAASTKGINFDSSLCAPSVNKSGNTYKIAGPATIKAGTCDNSKSPSSPETLDAIYVYVALFVASSAIFAYRRHLAKR